MSSPSAEASDNSGVSPPRRFIFTQDDMQSFQNSNSKKELLRLVGAMGKSCTISDWDYDPKNPLVNLSPALASWHGSLQQMQTWLQELPPDQSIQARFGNPAFRQWHRRLKVRVREMVRSLLDCHHKYPPPSQQDSPEYSMQVLKECSTQGFEAAARDVPWKNECQERGDDSTVTELAAYLHDAFGHPVRLDYGTGHESSFMVFLYALCKLGCFGNADPNVPPSTTRLKAVTLSLFHQYLHVTRGLQTEYMLEPAGSHGVWGLDDYHCLPFYFGACQLVPLQEEYTPSSIHDVSVLHRGSDTFLYFACIRFIRELKQGAPFFESSPMLNDISNLPLWSKVSSGLLKLYEGEVLDKMQVVQHFVFGNIFKASWTPSQQQREAPTETFRELEMAHEPATRAPWA